MKKLVGLVLALLLLATPAAAQISSCTGPYTISVVAANHPGGSILSCPRCGVTIIPSEPIDRNQSYTITVDGITVTNFITSAPDTAPITSFWAEVPSNVQPGARPETYRIVPVRVIQGVKEFCGSVRITQSNPVFAQNSAGGIAGVWVYPYPGGPIIDLLQQPVRLNVDSTRLLFRAWNVGQKYLLGSRAIRVFIDNIEYVGTVNAGFFPGGYDVTVDISGSTVLPGNHQVWMYTGVRFSPDMPAISFAYF